MYVPLPQAPQLARAWRRATTAGQQQQGTCRGKGEQAQGKLNYVFRSEIRRSDTTVTRSETALKQKPQATRAGAGGKAAAQRVARKI